MNSFILPNVDFSTAQEINGLEPSPIPGLEKSSFNSGNLLEATLEEVQNILKDSPDLPRLTKGEILDLIENITKQDMEKLRSLNRNRTGKSVLLVMPYSPKKNGENMEDLYTKKPVTQLIDNENVTNSENKKFNKNKKNSLNPKKDDNRFFGRNVTKINYRMTFPTSSPTEILYDTTSPMTTESTTIEVTTFRRRIRPPRTRPPTTSRPTIRRRRPTISQKKHQEYPIIQSDKFLPENAIKVTRPPFYRFTRRTTTAPVTESSDLNIAESGQENIYANPPPNIDLYSPLVSNFDTQDELTRTGPVFKTISNQLFTDDDLTTVTARATTFKPLPVSLLIPEGFENIFKNLNLDSTLNKERILKEAMKASTVLPKTTMVTTTVNSISPLPNFEKVADNLSPDMRNLLMTFGLIPNPEEEKVKKEETPLRSVGIEDIAETYAGFKPLPENGTPNDELDSLLASFGLGRNARKSKEIRRIDNKPLLDLSVVPESMMGIVKNLGLSDEVSIRENSSTKNTEKNEMKSIANWASPVYNSENDRIDNFPEKEKVSAEDIGDINELFNLKNATLIESSTANYPIENNSTESFVTEQDISTTEFSSTSHPEGSKLDELDSSTIESEEENNTNEVFTIQESHKNEVTETTTKGTSTSVVFNPTYQKIIEHEKEQLDKLVELIKALKKINGSATEEDFKNFDTETLREFTKVLNESQRTTFLEESDNEINPLHNFEDVSKSKSKRQEATTESLILASEPSISASDSGAITESEVQPNILEESFGKLPEEEIETSTPKSFSSGVYYMIDWNTFLEVDNTKGTHVNLRFQPKVGDPGRFYSINNN